MSSRTIFKSLENALKAILIEERKVDRTDKDRANLLQQQKSLLKEIADYINTYNWLKHQESKERIRFFLKNKYSYEEYCNNFDTTYEAAKVSVSYANQKAIEKVGKKTIDLVLEGKIDEARASFYFRSGQLKLRNYIIDSAIPNIPEAEFMSVDIAECKNELSFLRLYSQAMLDIRVELIEKEKLAYLRYILEGDNPKLAEERLYLLELLQGKKTVKEYIKEAQERNIY